MGMVEDEWEWGVCLTLFVFCLVMVNWYILYLVFNINYDFYYAKPQTWGHNEISLTKSQIYMTSLLNNTTLPINNFNINEKGIPF